VLLTLESPPIPVACAFIVGVLSFIRFPDHHRLSTIRTIVAFVLLTLVRLLRLRLTLNLLLIHGSRQEIRHIFILGTIDHMIAVPPPLQQAFCFVDRRENVLVGEFRVIGRAGEHPERRLGIAANVDAPAVLNFGSGSGGGEIDAQIERMSPQRGRKRPACKIIQFTWHRDDSAPASLDLYDYRMKLGDAVFDACSWYEVASLLRIGLCTRDLFSQVYK
jgi:hypothetical protein